jgi:hypothetical protein
MYGCKVVDLVHTSVRHSPGVVIKNPSSPWSRCQPDVEVLCGLEVTDIFCVRSHVGIGAQVVLELLGNNLFIDIEVWQPVSIHSVVGHGNLGR